ncbi:hypothetical protein [Enterococcus dongliensis]|uniref:Uncharacterized protein n=1 Tax=Enterococcus dongliensis TaxID=2559925 RepID=A0ABU3ERB7_9ENTE|nr:hypothetical protein [Enterococcus dongliensis]MDT2597410.1 hypothetical protein [Enterococcus dongliensis]MDT2648067.1 hypothetical protein [Enterococcus dongliensis]
MLTEKEKAALDRHITAVPEETKKPKKRSGLRKNAFGESLEFYQDDLGAPIYNTDTIYYMSIQTETERKTFNVLLESAQELIDEYADELETVAVVKHLNGKEFKKTMEVLYGE